MLRREVLALKAELDEYRRQSRAPVGEPERVWSARLRLGGRNWRRINGTAMRAILYLADRPGRVATNEGLRGAVAIKDPEETAEKLVHTAVCLARKELRRHGYRIETVRGLGYSMTLHDAAAIKRLIGEAPDA